MLFVNHYECPRCGFVWFDEWDCMVDDDCPSCGARHISPFESVENTWDDSHGQDS